MAKIDYLKEKADKHKIMLKFILNILLAISIGISGLIYGFAMKTITEKVFWFLTIPLLIFFIKGAIMTLVIWHKSSLIDEEILREN